MAKDQVVRIPLGLDPIRAIALQSYTSLRKVLHQLDRLYKEGADGPRVFAAWRALTDLEKISTEFSLPAFEKELKSWISNTRDRIKAGQEEFKAWFSTELEKLLADQFGLQVRGVYPVFIASYFRIKVDVEHDSAEICFGADEEPLESTKADPQVVAQKINGLQRELEGNLLPDDAFLARFAEAYDRAAKLKNLEPTEKAPILEVLNQFVWEIQSRKFVADPRRENFRPYSRVNLAYQLFRLVNKRAGHRTFELTVAGKAEASRKETHLWVPTNDSGDGTHYAWVVFK
jgi:hypothetical protein